MIYSGANSSARETSAEVLEENLSGIGVIWSAYEVQCTVVITCPLIEMLYRGSSSQSGDIIRSTSMSLMLCNVVRSLCYQGQADGAAASPRCAESLLPPGEKLDQHCI